MSLERKSAKPYFAHDLYTAMQQLADRDGVTVNKYIELIVEPVVRKRMHDTIALAESFRRLGIVRNDRESPEDQAPTD